MEKTKNMRLLNPEDIDQLITVSGMVTRTSQIIPEMREGGCGMGGVSVWGWGRCSMGVVFGWDGCAMGGVSGVGVERVLVFGWGGMGVGAGVLWVGWVCYGWCVGGWSG